MKTAKGSTYTTLLDVNVENGYLHTSFRVPMQLGVITHEDIAKMIPHVNDRITSEVKPGATYEKCLEQIELHRDHLTKAYVKLFETYGNVMSPAPKVSAASKAAMAMLSTMPDKMLREYGRLHLADAVNDYLLPDERDTLIDAVIKVMDVASGNGKPGSNGVTAE